MMKKVKIYLLLFTIILMYPISTLAIVQKGEDIYITDEANIIKKDTKDYIKKISSYLHDIELINYYVVTVKNLEDLEMEEYANQVYDEFDIGETGMLIMVARDEGLIRVQVGDDFSKFITEEEIEEYIDTYIIQFINNGNWDNAIKNGYNAFCKKICDYYHIEYEDLEINNKVKWTDKYKEYILLLMVALAVGISRVLIIMYDKIFRKRKYHDTNIDLFLFASLLMVNVVILVLGFFLEKTYPIIILCIEGFYAYTFLTNEENWTVRKKNKKQEDPSILIHMENKKKQKKKTDK